MLIAASPPAGLRERKKHATRQALLHAAITLATAHGADQVTVEEISEAANVSTRTFFNYFGSKEEAIVGDGIPVPDPGELRSTLERFPGNALEGVRHILRASSSELSIDREQLMMRHRLLHENPNLFTRHLAQLCAFESALAEAIAQQRGTDSHSDLYPVLMANTATAVMRVALRRWVGSEQAAAPLHQYLDEAFDLLAKGL